MSKNILYLTDKMKYLLTVIIASLGQLQVEQRSLFSIKTFFKRRFV